MGVRAGHAAVQDVPDDSHLQPGDAAFGAADRQSVEQRLRGVFVRAVAGVDHRRVDYLCYLMRRAGRRMADDYRVGRHRLQIQRGVNERLAFDDARSRSRDVDRVGGQTLRRYLKTRARARGGFEEEIDDGLPAQSRDFFDLSPVYVTESFGGVEDEIDLLRRELGDSQKVFTF